MQKHVFAAFQFCCLTKLAECPQNGELEVAVVTGQLMASRLFQFVTCCCKDKEDSTFEVMEFLNCRCPPNPLFKFTNYCKMKGSSDTVDVRLY